MKRPTQYRHYVSPLDQFLQDFRTQQPCKAESVRQAEAAAARTAARRDTPCPLAPQS